MTETKARVSWVRTPCRRPVRRKGPFLEKGYVDRGTWKELKFYIDYTPEGEKEKRFVLSGQLGALGEFTFLSEARDRAEEIMKGASND